MKKQRLDQLVFDLGLTESRERAKTTIMAGLVFVDDRRVDKPGTAVSPESKIEIRGETMPYVSRGGLKLVKALETFPVSPEGAVCVDCGASTGGFTDVLLRNGAKKVYAVDVGYGQLAWSLRNDERVVCMERTNIRYVTRDDIPEVIDLAVMDLSFISIRLVLPAVRELLKDDGYVVCLVKPQFEAGKDKIGKKGVVRDKAVHLQVLEDFWAFSSKLGFTPLDVTYSPIKGPEGNIEYLGFLQKGDHTSGIVDLNAVVEASHQGNVK